MANPIAFEPKKVDPRIELQRRLDRAPLEHGEALLVAYDLLEEAHRQGLLDLVHGAVGSKNAIFAKLAAYAANPRGTAAMRNLIVMFKLFGGISPETLNSAATEPEPPSLWHIFRTLRSREGRRGLNLLASLATGIGKAQA